MSAAEQTRDEFGLSDHQGSDNSAEGISPDILTKIYEEQINLVVLQRSLSDEVSQFCQRLVESQPNFNLRAAIKREKSAESLTKLFPDLTGKAEFVEDLDLLMDMYACLFELEEVGIRLQVLDRAMCPRFHTDKLGCRLVSTYKGPGTEWLHNNVLDRTKLGAGNKGLSDDRSGLYANDAHIQQVKEGDVVLLKGEGWWGNEGLGAVHRSPAVPQNRKRIVVTMDFA